MMLCCPVLPSRLNWQLHFGEPPKWAPGVKFVLVDVAPSEGDIKKAAVVLRGDATAVAQQLTRALAKPGGWDPAAQQPWRQQLADKVGLPAVCYGSLQAATSAWVAETHTRILLVVHISWYQKKECQ